MQIRADAEVVSHLAIRSKDYGKQVTVSETGTVLAVGDGIARVYGTGQLAIGRTEFHNGASSGPRSQPREEDNVGVAIMGDFRDPRRRHRQAHRADRPGSRRAEVSWDGW